MTSRIITLLLCLIIGAVPICLEAQTDPPNDANASALKGTAGTADRFASIPVNLYTGLPTISLPLYSYSHRNGLNLNISLDYFAGGVQVNQSATPEGLGWMLNAGGLITRTVRGMPDDISSNGFLYNGTLPSNYQPYGFQYYHDSLDAEQDIFQFNFNGRSGKFLIGKNGQIVTVPLTKLKVSYSVTSGGTSIATFYIVTEDGVKYIFNDKEYETDNLSFFKCGYNNMNYATSWYLSQIVAPFGTDTIYFNYNAINESNQQSAYPQTVYVRTSDNFVAQHYTPTVTNAFTKIKIASIIFPDKKNITFSYDGRLTYDGTDFVLDKIKVNDSVFRYGYRLNWSNIMDPNDTLINGRSFLHGLIKYTSTAAKNLYTFYYQAPWFAAPGTSHDTLGNDRDHWGFYNTYNNGSNAIPTVSGVYTGAVRDPVGSYMSSSSLQIIVDSLTGSQTRFDMEPNDVVQYTTSPQTVAINAMNSTNNAITLSQTSGAQYTMNFAFDNSFSRTGSPPFSGTCAVNVSITSTDGLTTYASTSISLFQLFYVGSAGFTFTVPNGNYRIQTSLPSCSVTAGSLPVNITWQNEVLVGNAVTMGGLRIKHLIRFDPVVSRSDTIATYSYLTTSGQSSGFLGAVPIYTYPYQRTVINPTSVTTNYTAIGSDPINDLNYTQGSPVGYSRVIVYKGSPSHNLGSQVYEFTSLQDAGYSQPSASFPFAPVMQPDWVMGLPKRVSVYDSTGRLVQITHNTYTATTSSFYNNTNFQSLKLGKISTTYNGDPTQSTTPYTEYYTGQLYYPQSGRSDISWSIDSFYHSDGSLQVRETDYQYDSNYNVTQVTTPYDPTRGLTLQRKFYYPYNYTLSGAVGRLRDSGNISKVVSSESWITGDANPRMTAAQITDYQQLTKGEVKPLTLYTLQSNAPVAQSVIGTFNPASLVRNSSYLVAQKRFVTYDSVGNLIQTQNALSGQNDAVIMDYFNQFPVARVSNAAQSDIAYTSFESDGSGNWSIPSSVRNRVSYLTGKSSYDLSNGSITKTSLNTATTYIISYWDSSNASVTVSGAQNITLAAQQKGWNLYTQTISGVSSVTISGTGLIDELRLYPNYANMTTSTYEPMVGITSGCDANSSVSYYLYDNLNRVQFIKDKDLNVVRKFDYDDRDSIISLSPNWVNQGSQFVCEVPHNGNMDRIQVDTNYFSDTYGQTRLVYDHQDCSTCAPSCPTPQNKLINCVCQPGTRYNDSSVHTKVNGVWVWVCSYHYLYPDGTTSSEYQENDSSSCPLGCVGPNCGV